MCHFFDTNRLVQGIFHITCMHIHSRFYHFFFDANHLYGTNVKGFSFISVSAKQGSIALSGSRCKKSTFITLVLPLCGSFPIVSRSFRWSWNLVSSQDYWTYQILIRFRRQIENFHQERKTMWIWLHTSSSLCCV